MSALTLIIFGLGIWRISALFILEDGPFNLFLRLRESAGIIETAPGKFDVPESFWAGLLSCVWCLSLWVSPVSIIAWYYWPGITLTVMTILALSTLAIIVDSIT